ncbi:DUF2564 family protein [Ectobacillus sp. sgz5001026]|uniref:DUF2564 family protein n=1 Tax=Ectobacillus sp. sgz5001026 TaxID=3242473 RepID=UPI0036D26C59
MSEPFTDLEQIFLKVETAEKMVGSATVTMDPELLQHAATSVSEAKEQLDLVKATATELDEHYLRSQEKRLTRIEKQLLEANQ